MIPCPGCARFIRPRAGGCPFCDAVLPQTPSPWGPMVAGAVLGLTLVSCVGGDDGGGSETNVAAYGCPDVGVTSLPDDSTSTDASETSSGDATDSSGGSSSGGTTSTDGGGTTTSADSGTGGSTSATGESSG